MSEALSQQGSLRDLLDSRLYKVAVLGVAHGMAADSAERMNIRLGVPVVVLTAVVGTSVFASLTDLGKANVAIAILGGVLSVAATVLAALQTFLNFGGKALQHARTAAKLNGIGLNIEAIRTMPDANVAVVDKMLNEVFENAPRVSRELQQAAQKEVDARIASKKKLESIMDGLAMMHGPG